MPKTCLKVLASFNRYPLQTCFVQRPERYHELLALQQKPLIARGSGLSYGDAALNENGVVLLTERLNRIIDFDTIQGILTAETGVLLHDILALIVPHGWFLPVVPGTQEVSLGGCVAADVHGKNHVQAGCFSRHVLAIELITAAGTTLTCSPEKHADLFWATMGGMGLTGIIGSVRIQLLPITTSYLTVHHTVIENLEQALAYLQNADPAFTYHVIWLNLLTDPKALCRGIAMCARHSNTHEVANTLKLSVPSMKKLTIPYLAPNRLLNSSSIKLFNNVYFAKQKKKSGYTVHYHDFFFPLDNIKNWNYLYGKRGFVQYQCVLPAATALQGFSQLLNCLRQYRYLPFLSVLKRFGENGQGLLSFPTTGYSLALDMPIYDSQFFQCLTRLDEITLAHNGRIYLAKDARLAATHFKTMYPRYTDWLAVKQKTDPNWIFSSSLSRRLHMDS